MSEENRPRLVPAWARELSAKYRAGIAHAFILHFGVRDYVEPGVRLHQYLDQVFVKTRCIAHYDRATGITFPVPTDRSRFDEIVGLSSGGNDALAALRAVDRGSARPQEELPKAPAQALPLLEALLRSGGAPQEREGVVIIDFAETVLPASDKSTMSPADRDALVTMLRWGSDPQIAANNNVVILITNNIAELAPDIRAASAKWETVLVPPPNYDERMRYIEYLFDSDTYKEVESALSQTELSTLTAGLSRLHIEDLFLRADANEDRRLTVQLVRDRKADILRSEYADVLAPFDPKFGWRAIGGLQHVKDFFNKNVIAPMRTGNVARVPMGVLLTGPAGTGKSAVAEAVAFEAGINAVLLKPEKILGKYLGEAEQKLEKALQGIQTLSPCLCFIDEIDQKMRRGEGGSDGASQAQNNVFGRLLEFMADTSHRGKIIFLAASNRPDLLDAALKRPGRFDKKVPFLMPGREERLQIIEALMRKNGIAQAQYLVWDASNAPLAALLDATEGWSGAEIEGLIVKATEIAQDDSRDYVSPADLVAARNRLSPSTSDVEFMTAIALRECNDLDLLPEQYRTQLQDRSALEQRVEALTPRGKRAL